MFGLRECRKSPPSLFSYSFLTVLVVKRCVHRLRPHKTSLFVLNRQIPKAILTTESCIATGLRFTAQEDDFFVQPASKEGHQQQPHAVDFPVCLLWDNDCEFPLWISGCYVHPRVTRAHANCNKARRSLLRAPQLFPTRLNPDNWPLSELLRQAD